MRLVTSSNSLIERSQIAYLKLKSIFKKLRIILPLLLIIVFGIIIIKIINIKEVICMIDNNPCPQIYNIDTEYLLHSNLIFLNSPQVISQIIRNNPTVGNVVINKKFPNVIVINLILRNALYLLITQEQTMVLDKEGVALILTDKEQTSDLIPIESKESFAVGQKIVSPSVLSAMKLAQLLGNSALRLRSIKINELTDIIAITQSGAQMRFNGLRDIGKQVDSVKFILDQSVKLSQTEINEIDVRFDDPVIK